MEDNREDKQTYWESLLYRLQKEFDLRYVLQGGVFKLMAALVFTTAALILSGFMLGVIALLKSKYGL